MSRTWRRVGASWCTRLLHGASRVTTLPKIRVRTRIPYGARGMSWSVCPTASSLRWSCSRVRVSTQVPLSLMRTIYLIRRRCIPAPGSWSRCPATGLCAQAASTPASSRRIFPVITHGFRMSMEQGPSSPKTTPRFRHRARPFRKRPSVSETNPPHWRRSPTSGR